MMGSILLKCLFCCALISVTTGRAMMKKKSFECSYCETVYEQCGSPSITSWTELLASRCYNIFPRCQNNCNLKMKPEEMDSMLKKMIKIQHAKNNFQIKMLKLRMGMALSWIYSNIFSNVHHDKRITSLNDKINKWRIERTKRRR